jgi:hypothetical protein
MTERWRQRDTTVLPLIRDGVRSVPFIPSTSQDSRDRADECERLAASTINASNRESLLDLARRWRALADADERAR